jgi:hypothetical protein
VDPPPLLLLLLLLLPPPLNDAASVHCVSDGRVGHLLNYVTTALRHTTDKTHTGRRLNTIQTKIGAP